MNKEANIIDYLNLSDMKTSEKQTPQLIGILYEKIGDGYGGTILKEVSKNVVVVGGAISALEHLCGVDATWSPATLNEIYGINAEKPYDITKTKIALYGIGTGGSGMDFGSVVAKDIKSRDIPKLIPLRTCASLAGTTDADKYFLKKDNLDGTFSWYLKEFDTPVRIKTLWKDAADDDTDGTEVTEEIFNSPRSEGLITFAEFDIKLNKYDGHEYFESIGAVTSARYNTLGLFLGEKILIKPGEYDYVGVSLMSYLNFNNRDISEKTESSYTYRILSLV